MRFLGRRNQALRICSCNPRPWNFGTTMYVRIFADHFNLYASLIFKRNIFHATYSDVYRSRSIYILHVRTDDRCAALHSSIIGYNRSSFTETRLHSQSTIRDSATDSNNKTRVGSSSKQRTKKCRESLDVYDTRWMMKVTDGLKPHRQCTMKREQRRTCRKSVHWTSFDQSIASELYCVSYPSVPLFVRLQSACMYLSIYASVVFGFILQK